MCYAASYFKIYINSKFDFIVFKTLRASSGIRGDEVLPGGTKVTGT